MPQGTLQGIPAQAASTGGAGRRRDGRADRRRTQQAAGVAARRRPDGGRTRRRPLRRPGGDPFRRPAAGRRVRRVGRDDRAAFGAADAGRRAGPGRTQPHRRGARGAAAARRRIGVRRDRRRLSGAARRAGPAGRLPLGAGRRRAGRPAGPRLGSGRRRGRRTGTPMPWCWRSLRPGCRDLSSRSRRGPRRRPGGSRWPRPRWWCWRCPVARRCPSSRACWWPGGERLHAKAMTLTSRKWGRRGNVELVRLSFGRFGDELARTAGDEDLLSWAAAGPRGRLRHRTASRSTAACTGGSTRCRSTGRGMPAWSPNCGPAFRRRWRWRVATSTASGCPPASRRARGRRRRCRGDGDTLGLVARVAR